MRAQEFGDSEALTAEERKRQEWEYENELRRHNFVGFAHQLLKEVIRKKLKDGTYEDWIKDAQDKSKKRIDERMKGKGGDAMDIEY